MYIYELSHESTPGVFYIGKTHDVRKRLTKHLTNSRYSKIGEWILNLKDNNQKPKIKTLIQCEDREFKEWEQAFIFAYRLRYGKENILNVRNGGENSSNKFVLEDQDIIRIFKLYNEENLNSKQISKRLGFNSELIGDVLRKDQAYMKDPKWDSYQKSPYHHNKEVLEKISAASKGNTFNVGRPNKNKGKRVSEETRLNSKNGFHKFLEEDKNHRDSFIAAKKLELKDLLSSFDFESLRRKRVGLVTGKFSGEPFEDPEVNLIFKLKKEGFKTVDIAEIIGVNEESVRRILKFYPSFMKYIKINPEYLS